MIGVADRYDKRLYEIERRLDEIERRLDALEKPPRLGPKLSDEKTTVTDEFITAAMIKLNPPSVDRSARILSSGKPVPDDYSHTEIEPETGMQKGYIVLTPEERSKGFVRPVRTAYRHLKCGGTTTMALSIAQTLARDPGFYLGGYCATFRSHFGNEEFVWPDDGTQVGS